MVRRTRPNKGGRIAVSCVQKTPGGTAGTALLGNPRLLPLLQVMVLKLTSPARFERLLILLYLGLG
jgi:hypothetical protein